MSVIIRVAGAAIVAAVCAMVVRKQVPEIGLLLSACAGVMILLFCSDAFSSAVALMDKLIDASGLSSAVVTPVMKVTGTAIVTKLAADLCRDAKEGALASVVETAGSVLSLWIVLPLISAVVELLTGLIE